MSESDLLTIRLFLVAAGLTFLGIGMSAAGWKHKLLINGMFGLAGLSVMLALFWQKIAPLLPAQGSDIASWIATNPWGWFGLFVVGMVTILWVSRSRAAKKQPTPIVTPAAFDAPLRQIRGRAFTNENVDLDGVDYIECRFTNVTFRWNGTAGTRMTNCVLETGGMPLRIGTTNPVVQQTIEIFRAFLAGMAPAAQISVEVRPPTQ